MVNTYEVIREWVKRMYEVNIDSLNCEGDGTLSVNNCLQHIKEAVCRQAYEDWEKEDIDARHCIQ